MARLTHTGAQLDAAIRKVRSDFADVSSVDAAANDVRAGKKIINAQKQEVIGSMPESIITPIATISGDTIGDTVTDYPIQIAPGGTIDKAGYVEIVPEGEVITKYIKTETKICTPDDTIQEIVPSSGKLLSKVTVRVSEGSKPTLYSPTISLTGRTITIINNSSNGNFVTGYDIYCSFNSVETKIIENTTNTTLNVESAMTNAGFTSSGIYAIYVKAKGTNFNDSAPSNIVSYTLIRGFTLTFNDNSYSADGYWATLNITYANGTTVNISEGIYSSVVSINSIDGYDSYSGFSIYYPSTNSYDYSASLPYTLTENITLSASYGSGCVCLVKGTQITLADKSIKLIENIEYEDDLLVWDFDEGQFNTSKPIWIQKQKEAHEYNHLVFSDGSELDTVNQHRIFNVEKGKFTYPMTDDTPIGTTTFNSKGEFVTLVSKGIIKKKVEYYNIITNYHMNAFTGTILTSCRLSNLYNIEDMQYQKDNRELHDIRLFSEVDYKWINGLRLLEQPLDINRDNSVVFDNSLIDYVKRLERDSK